MNSMWAHNNVPGLKHKNTPKCPCRPHKVSNTERKPARNGKPRRS